jgi:hypothetical protein
MIADEQMQAAHENILRLDQVIREKFESNIKVRKTVSGVVKDFDINLCRNSTIEELSEELWITSSRYWLSYALIALSAWVNDSKMLASNAVSEAVRTSELKANLFFCLVNLRFGFFDLGEELFIILFLRHFDQHVKIGQRGLEIFIRAQFILDLLFFFQDFLRRFLIVPEIRLCDPGVQLIEPRPHTGQIQRIPDFFQGLADLRHFVFDCIQLQHACLRSMPWPAAKRPPDQIITVLLFSVWLAGCSRQSPHPVTRRGRCTAHR